MDISNAIVIALTSAAVFFLNERRKKNIAPSEEGVTVLKMPLMIPMLGLMLLFLLVYITVLFFIEKEYDHMGVVAWGTILILLAFMGLGAYKLIVIGLFHKLEYDEDRLIIHYYKKNRNLTWAEIKEVNYSTIRGVFLLRTTKLEKIKVNQLLTGIYPFLEHLEQESNLDLDKYLKLYRKTKK